jgi:tetratricopeptide (TPR) repeat protein
MAVQAHKDTHHMTLANFDTLWDFNDPQATETRFRELWVQATDDVAYHAELGTQIARTLGLQRRFDDAHHLLDQIERELPADAPRPRIRYLLERGRVFNSSGKKEQARPLFISAYELALQAGEDSYAVDAAHMVAIVETGENVLAWNLKALAQAESSTQERAQRWRGSLYNNLAWTYHERGQFEQALALFSKAQAWHEQHGNPDTLRIARWAVARCLRSLGRLHEALAIQQTLLALPNLPEDGYISEEIGECLLLLGRGDEAKPHFARAYALLCQDAWLVANEPARLERLRALGD